MSLKLVLLLLLGLSLQISARSLPEDKAEVGAFPSPTKGPYNEWMDENSDVLNQLDQMVCQLATLATQEWGQLKRLNFDELVKTIENYVDVHDIQGLAGKDWNKLTQLDQMVYQLATLAKQEWGQLKRLNFDELVKTMGNYVGVHDIQGLAGKDWDELTRTLITGNLSLSLSLPSPCVSFPPSLFPLILFSLFVLSAVNHSVSLLFRLFYSITYFSRHMDNCFLTPSQFIYLK